MRHLLLASLALGLVGCAATYEPVPTGSQEAAAFVADTSKVEDISKAQMFVIAEVNGKPIRNSMDETRTASRGSGALTRLRVITRQLPASPMRVKLIASHQTAAPIEELASRAAGTFFEVEGVVDFTPDSNRRYSVRGELRKEGSSVWIEDDEANQPATDVVRSNPR